MTRMTGSEFRDAHPGFGRRADLEPDRPRDDLGLLVTDGPHVAGYLDRVDAGTWPRFGYWQTRLEAAGLVAPDPTDPDRLVVTDAGRAYRQEQAR